MAMTARQRRRLKKWVAMAGAAIAAVVVFFVAVDKLQARERRVEAKWGNAYTATIVNQSPARRVNIQDSRGVSTQQIRDVRVQLVSPTGKISYTTIQIPVNDKLSSSLWLNKQDQITDEPDYMSHWANRLFALLFAVPAAVGTYLALDIFISIVFALASLVVFVRRIRREPPPDNEMSPSQ